MSIIYDALKKTQDNPPQLPKPAQPAQNQNSSPKTFPPLKKKIVALSVFFLGMGISWLFITKVDWQFWYTKFAPLKKTTIPKRFKPRAQPMQNKDKDAKFILEGILLSQGQNTALINGQVCWVGNEVDGAKVVAISDYQVTLNYNNQKLILDNK